MLQTLLSGRKLFTDDGQTVCSVLIFCSFPVKGAAVKTSFDNSSYGNSFKLSIQQQGSRKGNKSRTYNGINTSEAGNNKSA